MPAASRYALMSMHITPPPAALMAHRLYFGHTHARRLPYSARTAIYASGRVAATQLICAALPNEFLGKYWPFSLFLMRDDGTRVDIDIMKARLIGPRYPISLAGPTKNHVSYINTYRSILMPLAIYASAANTMIATSAEGDALPFKKLIRLFHTSATTSAQRLMIYRLTRYSRHISPY